MSEFNKSIEEVAAGPSSVAPLASRAIEIANKRAQQNKVNAECKVIAEKFSDSLRELVITQPELVAEILDVQLLRDYRSGGGKNAPIKRTESGEVAGIYAFKYLNIESYDPNLRLAISTNGREMYRLCAREK